MFIKEHLMSKRIDITGKRFGRLVALKLDHIKKYKNNCVEQWLCSCDCGKEKIIAKTSLTSGATVSCGCRHSEALRINQKERRKHGDSLFPKRSRIYRIWLGMRSRCNNLKNERYIDYGGRGIKVCPEWDNYLIFKEWALSHGYSDNLSIDRIDNDKGYSPDNCRWATAKEQMRNVRYNVFFEYNGEKLILEDWAKKTGIGRGTLFHRLKSGMSIEKALTTPVRKN
jgi:hypothetical protein